MHHPLKIDMNALVEYFRDLQTQVDNSCFLVETEEM